MLLKKKRCLSISLTTQKFPQMILIDTTNENSDQGNSDEENFNEET